MNPDFDPQIQFCPSARCSVSRAFTILDSF